MNNQLNNTELFFDDLVCSLRDNFTASNIGIDNWLGGGCSAVRIETIDDNRYSFLLGNEGMVEIWDYEDEIDGSVFFGQIDEWETMTDEEVIEKYVEIVASAMQLNQKIQKED